MTGPLGNRLTICPLRFRIIYIFSGKEIEQKYENKTYPTFSKSLKNDKVY